MPKPSQGVNELRNWLSPYARLIACIVKQAMGSMCFGIICCMASFGEVVEYNIHGCNWVLFISQGIYSWLSSCCTGVLLLYAHCCKEGWLAWYSSSRIHYLQQPMNFMHSKQLQLQVAKTRHGQLASWTQVLLVTFISCSQQLYSKVHVHYVPCCHGISTHLCLSHYQLHSELVGNGGLELWSFPRV